MTGNQVAIGSPGAVQDITVHRGDLDGLLRAVMSAGLPSDQVAALEQAIRGDEGDPDGGSDKPGPRVLKFLGKLGLGTTKALGNRRPRQSPKDGIIDTYRKTVIMVPDDTSGAISLALIDEDSIAHSIADRLTADLLGAARSAPINVTAHLTFGDPIPPVTKGEFRRRNGDFFVLVDKWLVYLHSLVPVYRFWDQVDDVPQLSAAELRLLTWMVNRFRCDAPDGLDTSDEALLGIHGRWN